MHHYPFHLGDYATHTAHLEPMEDLAYRRMLDLYYRLESPLPKPVEEVARLIRLRDHVETIRCVLSEFFILLDSGWTHERCESELSTYRAMADGGRKGAAKRWGKPGDANPMPTLSPPYDTPNANQEPRTKNQNQEPEEPKAKTARKRAAPSALVSLQDLIDEGVDKQHATDWLAARKAKRLPLTPTAWEDTKAEAIKASLTTHDAIARAAKNGWAGFKASWPDPADARAGPPAPQSTVPMGHNPADAFHAKMNDRAATATKPPPGLRQRITG